MGLQQVKNKDGSTGFILVFDYVYLITRSGEKKKSSLHGHVNPDGKRAKLSDRRADDIIKIIFIERGSEIAVQEVDGNGNWKEVEVNKPTSPENRKVTS